MRYGFWLVLLLAASCQADSVADSEREQSLLMQPINVQDGVSFHNDMFILPFTYNERFTGSDMETMFQLSVKANIKAHFYFGYTQRSFWQAYAQDKSSPFRETNYNPELFFRYEPEKFLGWPTGLDFGVDHISNGKAAPESRSWNRVFATLWYPREHDRFSLKLWKRVHEKQKTDPNDPIGDDNPDITDYWGHMQMEYARCLDGVRCEHLWSTKVRGNLATRRGAIETHWAFPTGSKQISWYVLLFSGYGESLIDYNHAENRVGIGITLQPR